MAKKLTSEVTETTEVVIVEAPVEVVEEIKLSAQTLAEMEAGRAALAAHVINTRAELGEV
jgi:hypothetical protein